MNQPNGAAPPPSPAVTRTDIVWCYRHLLGRDPESDAAVAAHLGHRDFRALVESFVACDEYRRRQAAIAARRTEAGHRRDPLALPALAVDVDADQAQLARAWSKVRSAWMHLGRDKPHFSVITDERFLPRNLAAHEAQFWRSGEHEAETADRARQRHDRRAASALTCVEYGCGVGRVTMGLAKRFARVVASDISTEHLRIARERAAAVGATNVRFVDTGMRGPADIDRCDFFYSRLVFQHNPPPVIAALVDAAVHALNPKGVAIFQLPVYGHGYAFALADWLDNADTCDMEMHVLPQPFVFARVAAAGCRVLEVLVDDATGAPDLFVSNTFVVQRP